DHAVAKPRLAATLAELSGEDATLRVLPVHHVRPTRDGSPIGDPLTAGQLLDEIGSDAVRFLCLLERAERPLDLDVELAKRERTDNPLFLVRYAHARLARRTHAEECTRHAAWNAPSGRSTSMSSWRNASGPTIRSSWCATPMRVSPGARTRRNAPAMRPWCSATCRCSGAKTSRSCGRLPAGPTSWTSRRVSSSPTASHASRWSWRERPTAGSIGIARTVRARRSPGHGAPSPEVS